MLRDFFAVIGALGFPLGVAFVCGFAVGAEYIDRARSRQATYDHACTASSQRRAVHEAYARGWVAGNALAFPPLPPHGPVRWATLDELMPRVGP